MARLDCMWGQQRRSLAVDCNIAEKGINSTHRTQDMLVGTLLSDPSGCTTTPIRLGNEFNGKSTLRMTSIASVQLLCPFCCQFRFPCPACLQSRITNRIFVFVGKSVRILTLQYELLVWSSVLYRYRHTYIHMAVSIVCPRKRFGLSRRPRNVFGY